MRFAEPDAYLEIGKLHNRARTFRNISIFTVATFAICAGADIRTACAAETKQEFPKLGGMQIGKSPYEGNLSNADYRAEIAKLDFVVISRATPTLVDYARDIKAHNPDIVIAKYKNIAEVPLTDTYYDTPQRNKLNAGKGPNGTNAFDWWARDANGNRISTWVNNDRANLTEYVKPDANGQRWPQWRAQFDYDLFMKDPVWDGWYMDLTNWRPKWKGGPSADFSGGQVSEEEHNAAYRRGNRAYWDAIRQLTPDTLILVNFDWFLYDDNGKRNENLGPYEGANGGYIEYRMSWTGAQNNWQEIYTWYRRSMGYFVEPKFVLFDVKGPPNNYQFFRYSFATCLMADGYFDYSPEDGFRKGTVEWFDEFDLAGTATTRWMGLAVSLPPDNSWQSGVYRRDFENAVVLVNPYQNGRVTVSLESGLTRIDGRQDPVVNNGRVADQVTLEAGDGIVLLRDTAVIPDTKRPKPPVLSSE